MVLLKFELLAIDSGIAKGDYNHDKGFIDKTISL